MNRKYYYCIYGLEVESEIYLPEAYAIKRMVSPDVTIELGKMEPKVKELIQEGIPSDFYPEEYAWFYSKGVAAYYMEMGRRIVVEPDQQADERIIRAMLLGASFGHILFQRNVLSIHGSCVAIEGKALIVSGMSGAGKSTIVNELMKNQISFLADDTVAIRYDHGKLQAVPGYPQQKLCQDRAKKDGYDLSTLKKLNEESTKYAINRVNEFQSQPVPLELMVILKPCDTSNLEVEELSGKSKLDELYRNLYLCNLHQFVGVKPVFMRDSLEFVKQVPMYVIRRPYKEETVKRITDLIYELINKNEVSVKEHRA